MGDVADIEEAVVRSSLLYASVSWTLRKKDVDIFAAENSVIPSKVTLCILRNLEPFLGIAVISSDSIQENCSYLLTTGRVIGVDVIFV
jgi:hypothetical protein